MDGDALALEYLAAFGGVDNIANGELVRGATVEDRMGS